MDKNFGNPKPNEVGQAAPGSQISANAEVGRRKTDRCPLGKSLHACRRCILSEFEETRIAIGMLDRNARNWPVAHSDRTCVPAQNALIQRVTLRDAIGYRWQSHNFKGRVERQGLTDRGYDVKTARAFQPPMSKPRAY